MLGGGSATVFPAHVISPLQGLSAALPDSVRLSYAFGADPRTGKLAPAKAPHWTACTRPSATRRRHRLPDRAGLRRGRWMEMPPGVDPAAIATVEIAGTLTAEVSGEHLLGIRGIGKFALTAGAALFDGEVRPTPTTSR